MKYLADLKVFPYAALSRFILVYTINDLLQTFFFWITFLSENLLLIRTKPIHSYIFCINSWWLLYVYDMCVICMTNQNTPYLK